MNVSVIVPVYNVLDYLPRCIDSIINQTKKDIEIIIVDDGSTDGCATVADDYAAKDSRVTVIHKENGGLMSAWTTGVRASHGDYIGFMDSDDYALPTMYERLYSQAIENNADIVLSDFLVNGKKAMHSPLAGKSYTGEELLEKIQKHALPSPVTYSISMSRGIKLFRRNIIIDNLKYTDSLSRTFEDRYIVPAALLSAKSIYYTDEAYYCWMIRKGSNHGMYKEHLLDDIKRVYNVQRQVVEDKNKDLLHMWELAYMDFIRLYIDRNVIRIKSFKTKVKSIRALYNDELTRRRIEEYGHLMRDKLGAALRTTYKLHAPSLLALLSYLVKSEE